MEISECLSMHLSFDYIYAMSHTRLDQNGLCKTVARWQLVLKSLLYHIPALRRSPIKSLKMIFFPLMIDMKDQITNQILQ